MYYIHMYLGWIIPADRILYSTFSYFLQQFIHSCTLHLSVLKSAIKGKKLSQWQLACKLQAIKRGTFECLGKLLLQDSRARGDYSLLFGEWQKATSRTRVLVAIRTSCDWHWDCDLVSGKFPGLSYARTTNTPDTRDMQICHPVNQTDNIYKGVK